MLSREQLMYVLMGCGIITPTDCHQIVRRMRTRDDELRPDVPADQIPALMSIAVIAGMRVVLTKRSKQIADTAVRAVNRASSRQITAAVERQRKAQCGPYCD